MAKIRDRAIQILKEVPATPVYSDSNGALFLRLTGTSHKTMADNWAKGGIMTACNGFVGWYGQRLGSEKYLGRFDLETYLPTIGKGDSWVKSTKDTRPKYGDICRHTAFHIGVSLDFEPGDIWNHVDAGQGGKGSGHDILKRTRSTKPYNPANIQGWIDIEIYFRADIPEWLLGWWKVTWRGQDYYYLFDRNRQVKWTQVAPRYTNQAILVATDTGSVDLDGGDVEIIWNTTKSKENFTFSAATSDTPVRGTWNDSEPLAFTRMALL